MAQGSLDEVNRSAALQAVRRVCVSQPVRANASINTGAFGGILDNPQNSRAIQWLTRAGAEYRRLGVPGVLAPTFIGLYQINVVIAPTAPAGSLDLIVTANGVASKPVKLSVN